MADTTIRKMDSSGVAYTAAASKRQFPKPLRHEIVFVGRSNVGKSTLVNALSKRKNLARTSKTPGKTRLVFFYEAGPDYYFVDLPGYGYAKTSRDKQEAFSRVTDDYFNAGRPIALVLLLLDIRRGFGTLDLQMLEYVCHHNIEWQVVLTKADKLSRQAALQAERAVMEVVTQYANTYGQVALPPVSVAAGIKPGDERMRSLENLILDLLKQA
ncbi:MAG TPA: ribosome biogenesis GTP-binding protein YihA/YsxC [Clostridia bacterium]|nr:ribosome biogenesis GTP-binding protein YihA/YsxC [Clostridia bacterium]